MQLKAPMYVMKKLANRKATCLLIVSKSKNFIVCWRIKHGT